MPGQHTSLEARIVNKWTYIITTQVGLQLPRKNFKSRTLPDTVGADKPKDLARPWGRKPMELEGVCRISMSNFKLEIGRQVDDRDSFEWAPNTQQR